MANSVLKELHEKRKIIVNLNSHDFVPSLQMMRFWMWEQEELTNFLDYIKEIYEYREADRKKSGLYHVPIVADRIDQIVIGYSIFLKCRGGQYIRDVAYSLNIETDIAERDDRLLKRFKEKYILPFWDFLIENLERHITDVTPENEARNRMDFLEFSEFSEKYQETSQLINKISNMISDVDKENFLWNTIANSYRDVLLIFSNELKKIYCIESKEYYNGDFKHLLNMILEKRMPKNRFRETLINLLNSLWDHVNSSLHRKNLSEFEARRVYFWTCMIIYEVEKTLHEYTEIVS